MQPLPINMPEPRRCGTCKQVIKPGQEYGTGRVRSRGFQCRNCYEKAVARSLRSDYDLSRAYDESKYPDLYDEDPDWHYNGL